LASWKKYVRWVTDRKFPDRNEEGGEEGRNRPEKEGGEQGEGIKPGRYQTEREGQREVARGQERARTDKAS
jgi:hypothetical protein